LLHVESLCAGYGDSIIIEDIGFSLAAGSSLALLGRNGVGKSTLFRTLLGHARQRSDERRRDHGQRQKPDRKPVHASVSRLHFRPVMPSRRHRPGMILHRILST